jgi:hypothetical protein
VEITALHVDDRDGLDVLSNNGTSFVHETDAWDRSRSSNGLSGILATENNCHGTNPKLYPINQDLPVNCTVGEIAFVVYKMRSDAPELRADLRNYAQVSAPNPLYTATNDTITLRFRSAVSFGRGFRATYQCGLGTATEAARTEAVDFRAAPLTQSYTVGEDGHTLISATAGVLDWQCFTPYDLLTTGNEWRTASDPVDPVVWNASAGRYEPAPHSDASADRSSATDIVTSPPLAGRWLRIAVGESDALPTQRPPAGHCRAESSGWLSGWDASTDEPPEWGYDEPGTLPRPQDGAQPLTACFGNSCCGSCVRHTEIRALNCGSFMLWSLPTLEHASSAYCVAPSTVFDGLPDADCEGSLDECTDACEASHERRWTQVTPPHGHGTACPLAASDCQAGDGACTCPADVRCDQIVASGAWRCAAYFCPDCD